MWEVKPQRSGRADRAAAYMRQHNLGDRSAEPLHDVCYMIEKAVAPWFATTSRTSPLTATPRERTFGVGIADIRLGLDPTEMATRNGAETPVFDLECLARLL
jgi:hypothetical protein